jgi:predicted cytidylate kinase
MLKTNIIISLNGQEGSGKSTIAQMIADELKIPRYYMGQIFRDMAKERGMTMAEFRKICETDPTIDNKLDDYVIKLAQEKEAFIIESRTAWHFIPQSIKVFLKVDSHVAAERIFKGLQEKNNRGNEDAGLDSVENIQQSIIKRRAEDSARYFSLYGIEQDDDADYDIVIDTTKLTIQEVFNAVLQAINEKLNQAGSE